MKFIKTSPILLPIIVFILFLTLASLKIFELHPSGTGTNYYADNLFYYSINIIAWLSGAFLLNLLINTFLWGGLFRSSISNSFNQIVIDFVAIAIYILSFIGILTKVLQIELNSFWITLAIIFLIIGTSLRRRALALSSGSLFTTDKPFNIGDWIEIVDNTLEKVAGEVTNIKMRNITLRSDDNAIIVIPQSILNSVVVKNYSGTFDEISIELLLNLSSAYPTERVMRVLKASATDALLALNLLSKNGPKITINATNELGIEYSVKYYIQPKHIIDRTKINNLIYSKVLSHLTHTGMKLITKDSQFPTAQSYFQFGYDKKFILLHNELFSLFTTNEINSLSDSITLVSKPKDTVLIKEKDSGESMFLLVEGLLRVSTKTNNKEIELAILSPGAYIGEMSLFTGEPRSATITIVSDAIVCEIKKDDIQDILNNRLELVEAISNTIAKRTSMNMQAIENAGKKEHHFYDNVLGKIKSFFNL